MQYVPTSSKCFETGVTYYTSSADMAVRDNTSEMLIPINHIHGVCAVLRLSNKRRTDVSIEPFIPHDLAIASLTSTILLNHIRVKEEMRDDSNTLDSPISFESIRVVKFDEGEP